MTSLTLSSSGMYEYMLSPLIYSPLPLSIPHNFSLSSHFTLLFFFFFLLAPLFHSSSLLFHNFLHVNFLLSLSLFSSYRSLFSSYLSLFHFSSSPFTCVSLSLPRPIVSSLPSSFFSTSLFPHFSCTAFHFSPALFYSLFSSTLMPCISLSRIHPLFHFSLLPILFPLYPNSCDLSNFPFLFFLLFSLSQRESL